MFLAIFRALFIFLLVSNTSYALSITTYNIRNFDSNSTYSTDLNSLVQQITKIKTELFVFQEIVDTQGFKTIFTNNFKDKKIILSTCGGFAKQKLALAYDKNKFRFIKSQEDTNYSKSKNCNRGVRPLFKVKLEQRSTGLKFWVLLVHLKAGASSNDVNFRKKQFSLLSNTISKLKNFFIVGDFNTTRIETEQGQYFFDFIDENSLISSTDSIDCTSFWSGGIRDGLYYPSRLDHILVSKSLAQHYEHRNYSSFSHCEKVKCNISTLEELGNSFQNVSDHCPVKLELTKGK